MVLEPQREETMMREFITAVEAKEVEKADVCEFEVVETGAEGKETKRVLCKAFRPSPSQTAYLTAALHRRASMETKISGVVNFCMEIMDEDTASYLTDRLLDRTDPFEIEELEKIVSGILEEFAGKDSEKSSTSSSTPQPSGVS